MSIITRKKPAPAGQAVAARWTRGNKDAVGTAASNNSPVWFTLTAGVTSEVYFPSIDAPQIRDTQFLVTDGSSFFHDGRRNFDIDYACLDIGTPGYKMTCRAKDQPYQLVQEIITSPDHPCLLIHCRLQSLPEAPPNFLERLHVYALIAPHLDIDQRGDANSGYVVQSLQGKLLLANRNQHWVAVGATVPFKKCSVGYCGVNDGWQDICGNRRLMTCEYDCAENGNIALTAELDLSNTKEFVLGLGFGIDAIDVPSLKDNIKVLRTEAPAARTALAGGLSRPFSVQRQQYINQWTTMTSDLVVPATANAQLYRLSRKVLLCHEDKAYRGAFVASVSIPWGEDVGGQDGYHLVWPRDMCQTATGLLAAGMPDAALRGLAFLAVCQQPDGTFRQNFLVDGTPYWPGLQLDEVSFPIILAYRLKAANALGTLNPLPMVKAAAAALILAGPQSPMERWEEAPGFSPSTLAANIASLICAATIVRELDKDDRLATFYEEHADFLERHLDQWTMTNNGSLLPGIKTHYIRVSNREDPDQAVVSIANLPYELKVPAREVVDAGFLELVRYGIRDANSPLIVDSVKVVDAVLREDFASPGATPRYSFYRYNHDGYGQKADGRSYQSDPRGTGLGGAWPLLAGERAHYEIARAGGNPQLYLSAFESFATQTGLLPEQVWSLPDNPQAHLVRGGATGAAVPLVWAHAEYIKLVHSLENGYIVDRIAEVQKRYVVRTTPPGTKVEIWNFQRKTEHVRYTSGQLIRFPFDRPFEVHWSSNNWTTTRVTKSLPSPATGIHIADIDTTAANDSRIDFTFYWLTDSRWEGTNYSVG
jgi:glucoamylase